MIGLWRPKPLIADISSSSGGMGAHLEIFAFALWLEKKGDLSSISVCPLRILSVPTAKLRATLSGLEEPPVPCAIIGNGALGSKISSFLAREGIEHLSLVDPDIFNPHNVVRNELGRPSIGLYKAKELKNDIEFKFANDRQQGGITCRARVTNIHSSKEKISEIVGPKTKWLIDSTADKRAFNYLCNKKQSYPVVRVEMVDQGRIGVLLAEGPSRNPRLDDLQATLYSLAAERDLLAKWLAKDQALPNILIGQGCTSDTLILADFQVASHAASFMPAINKRLSGTAQAGGIGLNVLHEDGTPAGWSWIHVPEFIEMKLERYNGKEDWTLRIHPDAYNFIQAEMKKHTETEAGGYMYGRYDIHKRIVTITHAFWTPPIEATATKLKLPPASSTMPEREFMEKTNGKLIPMGSWHSHLDGAPKMSATDEDQARKFAKDNTQTPHPVVMLIVSTRGQTGYVIYPENWT
jgi:proteasome lid subunit RPN8/RPN11